MTLTIEAMAGLATIQDAGRPGFRADGVPLCGAMDVASFVLANALVGNGGAAAAIEWALAGGSLRFATRTVASVTGAEVELSRNGERVPSGTAIEFRADDVLTVGRFVRGAFAYVAVRGGIDVPAVLGSRSTYLPAGFGGLDGRRLRAGDVLRCGPAPGSERSLAVAVEHGENRGRAIRAIEGPDTTVFTAEFRESFWASEFTLSPSANRVGYRLERESGRDPESRSVASGPACVGAIQVPGGGGAIVLMADGPTVGGYPKIGVVASVDLPTLAQKTPGERVRFERITVDAAQRLLRDENR
ncbi:biotin-dependent carboxyltransferase family protein [soil metagenome]